MAEPLRDRPAAPRFRARLVASFVVVAALAGGLLAVTSFLLVRGYRMQNFAEQARDEAQLSLISAPTSLSVADFEELVVEFRRRGGFQTVAVVDDLVFSSSPALEPDDLPDGLVPAEGEELAQADVEIGGQRYLVLAGALGAGPGDEGRSGSGALYFLFSKQRLLAGLAEIRAVLGVGWLAGVGGAAAFGHLIARRTLRPVRAAAQASESLAEGLLATRLDPGPDDEFGRWAHSFNRMAEALEAKIDDLARAAERERRFTSDVAHELRTPLTGMVSAASLLEAHLDDMGPEARRPAELLAGDVRRLHGLVLELLHLARLDAGQEEARLEPVPLGPALAAVTRPWGRDRPLEVEVEPGVHALADPLRFRQVVHNLVANAFQHGRGRVTVRARRQGNEVVVEVLDEGPGIDVADRRRVFERFHKADGSRTGGGTGLGLAIAAEQARLQGGGLEVGDSDGGGACFRFRLTWAPGVADEDGEADAPDPGGPAGGATWGVDGGHGAPAPRGGADAVAGAGRAALRDGASAPRGGAT